MWQLFNERRGYMPKNITVPHNKCSISNVSGYKNGRILIKVDIFVAGDLVDIIEKHDHIIIKRASVSSCNYMSSYKNSSSTKGMCVTLKNKYKNGIHDIDVIDEDTIEINVEQE